MTLHPILSEFPYIWGKFYFLFISVIMYVLGVIRTKLPREGMTVEDIFKLEMLYRTIP